MFDMLFNRIATRIAHRMDELINLPTTMSEDIRVKAEIELRSLRVLNFQRKLRAEVITLRYFYILYSVSGFVMWNVRTSTLENSISSCGPIPQCISTIPRMI